MKIGITGTRNQITEKQIIKVSEFLKNVLAYPKETVFELHHGDCIGADVTVAGMAKSLGYWIVCHPPEKDGLRGFFPSDEYKKPLTYFARNRMIVNSVDALLVVPKDSEVKDRGGTWYTYNYAWNKVKMKNVFIIWP